MTANLPNTPIILNECENEHITHENKLDFFNKYFVSEQLKTIIKNLNKQITGNKDTLINIIINEVTLNTKTDLENFRYNFYEEEKKIKKSLFYSTKLRTLLSNRTTIKYNEKSNDNCLVTIKKDSRIRIEDKRFSAKEVSYALANNIFVENIPKIDDDGDKFQISLNEHCYLNCVNPEHLYLEVPIKYEKKVECDDKEDIEEICDIKEDNITNKNYNYLYDKYSIEEIYNIAKSFNINYTSGYYTKDNKRMTYNKKDIINMILNNEKYIFQTDEEIDEYFHNKKETDKKLYYIKLKKRLYENTIEKINKNYEKPCLLIKEKSNKSYNQMRVYKKAECCFRVSYALHNNIFIENIPKYDQYGNKLAICHGKDCSINCIEPTHLELKTSIENNYDDKIRDGTLKRGENHSNSTITDKLAIQIKNSKGQGTQKERADKFNVSENIIGSIDEGRTWNHLFDNNNQENREKKRNLIRKNKNIMLTPNFCEKIKKRLAKNSKKSDILNYNNTSCVMFTGYILPSGYGQISINSVPRRAHIVSLEVNKGIKLEKNQVVRHLCNNKTCINPEHLKFGSYSENSIDSSENGSKSVKLKPNEVKHIKYCLKFTDMTIVEISNIFKISKGAINSIKSGKTWDRIQLIHPNAELIKSYDF